MAPCIQVAYWRNECGEFFIYFAPRHRLRWTIEMRCDTREARCSRIAALRITCLVALSSTEKRVNVLGFRAIEKIAHGFAHIRIGMIHTRFRIAIPARIFHPP